MLREILTAKEITIETRSLYAKQPNNDNKHETDSMCHVCMAEDFCSHDGIGVTKSSLPCCKLSFKLDRQ
jgi:hypothetical protein